MKEASIITYIAETLKEHYGDKIQQIQKVVIETSRLSNTRPDLIQDAYQAMVLEDSRFAAIKLEVKILPGIAFCPNCHQEFKMIAHRFVCACGKPSRQIVQGEELRISKVVFY